MSDGELGTPKSYPHFRLWETPAVYRLYYKNSASAEVADRNVTWYVL